MELDWLHTAFFYMNCLEDRLTLLRGCSLHAQRYGSQSTVETPLKRSACKASYLPARTSSATEAFKGLNEGLIAVIVNPQRSNRNSIPICGTL